MLHRHIQMHVRFVLSHRSFSLALTVIALPALARRIIRPPLHVHIPNRDMRDPL